MCYASLGTASVTYILTWQHRCRKEVEVMTTPVSLSAGREPEADESKIVINKPESRVIKIQVKVKTNFDTVSFTYCFNLLLHKKFHYLSTSAIGCVKHHVVVGGFILRLYNHFFIDFY